jgi:hypothetical protein
MAIEKKSLISSTPAAKSTAGKLANTKKLNAGRAVVSGGLQTAMEMKAACAAGKHVT